MKTIILLLISTFFLFKTVQAQNVSCSQLLQYVKENGRKKAEVSSFQLINSSWLKSVVAYTVENSIFVVAEIKKDEYGFNTKKYIFCGIPNRNWDSFYNGFYDLDLTYGERFHKYIIDYVCDCN